MSISPLPARPGSPESESRRARFVLALVVLGIAASLLAYAISPGVRHAVGHAAHSVKRAVVHVFDRDEGVKRPPSAKQLAAQKRAAEQRAARERAARERAARQRAARERAARTGSAAAQHAPSG